jgi:NADPH-dependent 2,4-dienoyl-CoA reductase/sulfur reductase-like enzyme
MLIPHKPSKALRDATDPNIVGLEDVTVIEVPPTDPAAAAPVVGVAKPSGRTAALNRPPPGHLAR